MHRVSHLHNPSGNVCGNITLLHGFVIRSKEGGIITVGHKGEGTIAWRSEGSQGFEDVYSSSQLGSNRAHFCANLGFGWLWTECLLLRCWHGEREACGRYCVPAILQSPHERECLLNEPIPGSLAFQINK